MEKTNLSENDLQVKNASLQENESETVQSAPIEKQRMFAAPFSFNGRIRRLEYGITYIIVWGLSFILEMLLSFMMIVTGSAGVFLIIYILLNIPLLWFCIAQGAKRCHDRDNSGWYQIIPLYVLWMIFADGDDYENEYGHDPKGRNCLAEFEA